MPKKVVHWKKHEISITIRHFKNGLKIYVFRKIYGPWLLAYLKNPKTKFFTKVLLNVSIWPSMLSELFCIITIILYNIM